MSPIVFYIVTLWVITASFQDARASQTKKYSLHLSKIASHSNFDVKFEKKLDLKMKIFLESKENFLRTKLRLKRELQRPMNRYSDLSSNQAPYRSFENSEAGEELPGHFPFFPSTSTRPTNSNFIPREREEEESGFYEIFEEVSSESSPTIQNSDPYSDPYSDGKSSSSNYDSNFTFSSSVSDANSHLTQNNGHQFVEEGNVNNIRDVYDPFSLGNRSSPTTSPIAFHSTNPTAFSSNLSTLFNESTTGITTTMESTIIVGSSPAKSTELSEEHLVLIIVLPVIAFLMLMAIVVIYLVKVKWKPRRRIDIEKTPSSNGTESISSSTASWHTSQRNTPIPLVVTNQANGKSTPISAWTSTSGRGTSSSS